ncbi:MAG TPA: hypothetical protein VFG37_07670 [Planctomycetota bacterium]|nr:hypothetical protein [Planctomycetota bacterium]
MKRAVALTKREFVVVALYDAGGATHTVDTEHVAMKAFELAPALFRWKHFPEQVDKDLVRVLLFDARKQVYGAHVTGRASRGWSLTEAGLEIAERAVRRLGKGSVGVPRHSPRDKRLILRERARLEGTEAFQKITAGNAAGITPREAETFFRLNSYVTDEDRLRKLNQMANLFADDREMSWVIRAVREKVPSR